MQKLLYVLVSWALTNAIVKALSAVGLGLATYAGLSLLLDGYLADVSSGLGLLGDGLQIFLLAGGGEAMSIVGGAMVAAMVYKSARVALIRVGG